MPVNKAGNTMTGNLFVNGVSALVGIKATANTNAHIWWYGADGGTRMILYTSSGAHGNGIPNVGSQNYTFQTDGTMSLPGTLYAGGNVMAGSGKAWLGTDGNVSGSIWMNLGYGDAYSAIVNRIESRGAAFIESAVARAAATTEKRGRDWAEWGMNQAKVYTDGKGAWAADIHLAGGGVWTNTTRPREGSTRRPCPGKLQQGQWKMCVNR